MHKLKSKILAIITVTIVAVFMLASVMPIASATTISLIDPTSGPVGTEVRVVGQVDTLGGTYKIYFDTTEVKSGACAPNSKVVDNTFIVPAAVNGSHTVKLRDVTANTNGTAIFTVETAYSVVATPSRVYPPSDPTTLNVTVTGGLGSTLYNFTVIVTDPSPINHTKSNVYINTTNAVGSGSVTVVYPTGFTSGNTSLIGVYEVFVDQVDPEVETNVASTTFTVGVTDKAEYQRTETVNIRGTGFTANENVHINVTDSLGEVAHTNVVNATTGNVTDSWHIPVNATLGTYNVNLTGTTSGKMDLQDFVVLKANLTLAQITAPSNKMRTETVLMEFNVTYPDASLYNVTDFQSMTVRVYYNTTFIRSISLSAANCDPATATWNVTWKIPKDAKIGSGYNFTFLEGSVVDREGNSGPEAAFSSGTFTISKADLIVGTINLVSPALTNRTLTASAKFNITYPDETYFTSTDLGWLNVTIYANSTSIANISLTSANYDSASKNWTVSWKIPWNASLGTGYNFTVNINAVEDTVTPTPNSGPTASVSSSAFEVRAAHLIVDAIYTDKASYGREETVTVWFTATYPDGGAVITGSANINITMVDGTQITRTASYVAARARFEATYYIRYDDPVGTWNSTLFAFNLTDAAGNTGPIGDRFRTFEVIKVVVYVLDVEVDVGSIHFRGETAEFYALVSRQGVAVNASVTATLYTPGMTKLALTATRIDTGLYKISYAIAVSAAEGTYTLVVNASKVIEAEVMAKGTNLRSFLLSPTLTGWGARIVAINGTVATIKTDVGVIKMNLTAIDAKIVSVQGGVASISSSIGSIETSLTTVNARLVSLNGTVATVASDVGDMVVSIEGINLKVVAINGTTATIKTDVGTIKGTVTSIDGDVATIQTDIGTVRTDISDIQEELPTVTGVPAELTWAVYAAVIFALISAIAAIISIVELRRKIA